ncbi:hypothetical protein DER44DRAFT_755200 [Fusarium oxysporum]|nr:hypothetical protein DER44DRAFT_755200 [Fusarium oxysporum]
MTIYPQHTSLKAFCLIILLTSLPKCCLRPVSLSPQVCTHLARRAQLFLSSFVSFSAHSFHSITKKLYKSIAPVSDEL